MTDVTVELRYDEDSEELAVVAVGDGEEAVILKADKDSVKSIVESYNAKHPEVKVIVEEVKPAVTPVPVVTPEAPIAPAVEGGVANEGTVPETQGSV